MENQENPEEFQVDEQMHSSETAPVEVVQPAMKKKIPLNTILNIILLIGLVVLYILFFTMKKVEQVSIPLAVQKSANSNVKVVFVNVDTVNSGYSFVKILKSELEGAAKKLQAEVLAEQSALEKEAADFQKQVQSNSIPEEKAKLIYEQLMTRQQALAEKKEKYTQMIAENIERV